MKRIHSRTQAVAMLMGAITLGGTAFEAFAEPPEGPPPSPETMIQKFDKNHDGKLDADELRAIPQERAQHRQEMLKKYDTNNDGKLDDAEREKMHQDFSAERFKELDKDGNGVLSLQEFQAARPMHGGWRHGRK